MTQGWDNTGNTNNPPPPDKPTSAYPTPGADPAGPYGQPGQPGGYPQGAGYPPPAGYPTGQPAWAQQAYAQGAYAQPQQPTPLQAGPPTPSGYPQPVYPATAYSQPGYSQPGYSQPGQPQPGYPQQLYPQAVTKPHKPGVVTGAAVLGFVQGGILVFLGIITLSGGSALSDLDPSFGNAYAGALTAMGVVTLLSAGLLIAGGVSAFNKKPWLLVAGSALSLVMSLWWLIQTNFFEGVLVWALLLAVMPILSIALILGSTSKNWMAGSA